ncbi:MAG: four helix bundle protein [Candidatus Gracilibacteria bacterium]|nr:four helix bundle protein [Candidatus Gracilibacteria bacterium]
MKENILKEKSFHFALAVVRLSQFLISEKKEFVLSKQFLRSGTAIGALIREAEYAQSRPDFISKLHIALKEANETEYWIELLYAGGFVELDEYKEFLEANKELLRMLISSIKTTKNP